MTTRLRKTLRLRQGNLRVGSVLHDVSTGGAYASGAAPVMTPIPQPPPPINLPPTSPGVGYIPPGSIDPWVSPTPNVQNMLLNGDFARRNVFGLAMVEAFPDTVGDQAITGSLGSVSGNILTAGGTGVWRAGVGPSDTTFWRDCRMSASFKMVATGAIVFRLSKYTSTTTEVSCEWNNGTFQIIKNIAGTPTTVATVAQAGTLNRWYWLEIGFQGTTVVACMYDTGGTVAGVTKASSTLLQTLTGTVSDTSVATGRLAIISSSGTASQWGGIATANGGVYVEMWQPESWAVSVGGALGGQAIGWDESVDCGPLNRQTAIRIFLPDQTRAFKIQQITPSGSIADASSYVGSVYTKLVSLGSGTVPVVIVQFALKDISFTDVSTGTGLSQDTCSVLATDSSSWVRKVTREIFWSSTARAAQITISDSATMGVFTNAVIEVQLIQFENLPTPTPWRNAPADNGARTTTVARTSIDLTTTSATLVEIDSRNLAINHLSPYAETLAISLMGAMSNTVVGAATGVDFTVDGVAVDSSTFGSAAFSEPVANYDMMVDARVTSKVAAGWHRIAARWRNNGGTTTLDVTNVGAARLTVTATRGQN